MDVKYNSVYLPTSVKTSLRNVTKKLSSFRTADFVNKDLFNPSSHLLKRQGRLLRPTLVLLGAYFLNKKPEKYVDLALSAELMHISSLIHDDMIDRDDMRRGSAAVHKKYGNEAALLAGDALISKAVYIASKYGEDVLGAMSDASINMCAGELLDYNFQKSKKTPTVDQCLNINELKSASLIASCCNIVAVHTKNKRSGDMYLFGKDLGVAFQIRDDIMDYKEWARNGKKNILVPNIVSSIEARKGERAALKEAGELNRKYIESASRRLGNGAQAKLLKNYANLIMVKI